MMNNDNTMTILEKRKAVKQERDSILAIGRAILERYDTEEVYTYALRDFLDAIEGRQHGDK